MDFSVTEDQVTLRDSAFKFAKQELNAGLPERDQAQEFSHENWKKCAEFGIQGLPMPTCYGGTEHDMLSVVLALEGLGRGCKDNGLIFALGAQIWSVQIPILNFASAALKERFLPRLISGEMIGGHAVTEPGSGSDVFSLRTAARRDGDSYVLNGQKTFVTSAPLASVFLVLATVDPAKGARGLTAFLVERNTPGLRVSGHFEKMGLRTTQLAEVFLDDCRVPAGNILGREGGGSAVFNCAMEWERAFILVPALGTMQRLLDECIKYATIRKQFGVPIGKNQAVANKIVEMQLRLETARLLAYRTAWLKSRKRRLTLEPSEVKLHLSESWVQCCLDAMQIHGGSGYIVETGIERELRDSLSSKLYSGTSEIQKVIIARYLGL